MNKKPKFRVTKEEVGQRIDKYLQEHLSADFSRVLVKKAVLRGDALVNGKAVKPRYNLKLNDEVVINIDEIAPAELTDAVASDIQLNIIYEDAYIVVVNKPAGMVVHPAAGHHEDTLVNALLYHCGKLSDMNGQLKPGIVHRLDKDTSGLLVVAKDNVSHYRLANQFRKHKVSKVYLAVIQGAIEHDEGVIDAPIARSLNNRKKMAISEANSREAQTRYKLLKRGEEYCVLEVYPKTGRTHQIRVHFAHLGHPLVGDITYGGRPILGAARQMLHAQRLSFLHPHTRQPVEFEAPIPEDMKIFLT